MVAVLSLDIVNNILRYYTGLIYFESKINRQSIELVKR